MDGQLQQQENRPHGEARGGEEVGNGEVNPMVDEVANSASQGAEAEAGPLLEGMEQNGAHNSSTSFGTSNASSPPAPPPSLLSLAFLRLSRALTTLPSPAHLRVTLLTILAISPLMYIFASWADAFYLPQAGFPIRLILFVFVFPSFWEELFWRVLLNPHPDEPPSPLPPWLHTRLASLSSRITSLLSPLLSSLHSAFPSLRSSPLPREWLADPKVFYGVLSTSLYVLAHPFSAWMGRPAALRLFSHPGFLLCCVVLGSACLVVYRRTGSAWAAILVHWVAVSVWMCLGGRHQAPF
ncbi:hypothetical protein CLOM_g11633 [Closterium sp. NIES-68]|nr:hypothetical protein CLOM_g11633 [Closterium sp. NIES-68]GJP78228.1 hypothetical protein CLOP_g8558 [Closterium sp. NIES-67]